ncbi:protein of unknown function [Aminobacter niigataensis]|nr:protein of unknown function [Aminobacter niigataensis]
MISCLSSGQMFDAANIPALLPIVDHAGRAREAARYLFGPFVHGLLALGLPDPGQILGVRLHLGAVVVRRAAVGVDVPAEQRQRALVLDDPAVIVAMDQTLADAAGRHVVAGAVFRKDVLPAFFGHSLTWGVRSHHSQPPSSAVSIW